jgi:hypothetical protein
MRCLDTSEMRFKEGIKTSDRGLENTTLQLRTTTASGDPDNTHAHISHRTTRENVKGKKVKVPRNIPEGPEREWRYSSTLS